MEGLIFVIIAGLISLFFNKDKNKDEQKTARKKEEEQANRAAKQAEQKAIEASVQNSMRTPAPCSKARSKKRNKRVTANQTGVTACKGCQKMVRTGFFKKALFCLKCSVRQNQNVKSDECLFLFINI